jgi:vanillate O-demethylase monooxygenase subunit
VTTRNLNAITPETPTTSHYFWAQAQDFALGDPTIADVDFQMVQGAFREDLAIIKGQQQNIDLNPHATRLNIAADSGGMQARRIVERLIEKERGTHP